MKRFLIIGIVLVVIIFIILVFTMNKKEKTTNKEENNTSSNNVIKEEISEAQDMNNDINKIKITINNTEYITTLENNDTAKELLDKLPLDITMTELNGNEKYFYFDESLPSSPSKPEKINTGDIMLYGSDCLVLFYDTFNTSYSYTKIGKIDTPTGLKENVGSKNIKVSITK